MTHFYFHSWRGDERLADELGLELQGPAQARDLAARDLGEMAREHLHASSEILTLGIDIANAEGAVLARLRLNFSIKALG